MEVINILLQRNSRQLFLICGEIIKGIISYGLYDYRPLEYEGYVYPTWANVLGWCIAGSSIAMIPAVAIYQIVVTPGTFCEVT